MSEARFTETDHPRGDGGKFVTKPADESAAELTEPLAPAPMSREDYTHLVTCGGEFADGCTPEGVDRVLGDLEGAQVVAAWDEFSDGDQVGGPKLVGRVDGPDGTPGPWRLLSEEMNAWLTHGPGDGDLHGGGCSECGVETVVEEDGVGHHLTGDGDVDDDADADHVAMAEDDLNDLALADRGPGPILDESAPLLSDELYEHQDVHDWPKFSGANAVLDS